VGYLGPPNSPVFPALESLLSTSAPRQRLVPFQQFRIIFFRVPAQLFIAMIRLCGITMSFRRHFREMRVLGFLPRLRKRNRRVGTR
jgi:hypothetical protein